jgi:pyruvate formate lyase activating enzyme
MAAVVFLPRCNLRCAFCHAGPLLREPVETIPLEAILEHIASRAGWIDGVVICGGEPTLWPGIGRLCQAFRQAGLQVKLDTNGTHPDRLKALLDAGLVDAVAMDLKAPVDERYHEVAGTRTDLGAINQSIDLLMASGVELEFRTTVCPAFLAEAEIHAMGRRIAGAPVWVLQPFAPANALDPGLRTCEPYNLDRMESLAEIGAGYVGRCPIRGQPEKNRVAVGPS